MGDAVPDGVRIQTAEVHDFANRVRSDADSGLSDAAQRAAALHGQGVVFGHSIASPVFVAAKDRYAKALENTEANLRAYVAMARALSDAAKTVADRFGHVDQLSAAQQKEVHDMLDTGVRRALALDHAGRNVTGVPAP